MQQIQIALPDELASFLKEKWGNLERKLIEIIVVEAYREGSISSGKLRELLGFSSPLEIEAAIRDASVEVLDGNCSPFQLKEMVETTQVTENALSLLSLIYEHQPDILAAIIDDNLALLPGGEDWKFGRRNK